VVRRGERDEVVHLGGAAEEPGVVAREHAALAVPDDVDRGRTRGGKDPSTSRQAKLAPATAGPASAIAARTAPSPLAAVVTLGVLTVADSTRSRSAPARSVGRW
jgi:hypothetical protein